MLIQSHVEALHLQRRRLQRRVTVRCKEEVGETMDDKGHESHKKALSDSFDVSDGSDEWGTHAEPDKPASECPCLTVLHQRTRRVIPFVNSADGV
jgi:hypothetical protein